MGFKRNEEREKLIYKYWKMGYTIDEISAMANIPRSSVGYYVRKFNRRHSRSEQPSKTNIMRGESGKLEDAEREEDDLVTSVIIKALTVTELTSIAEDLIRNGSFQDLYYLLNSLKLLREIMRDYTFTPEERQTIKKNINKIMQGIIKYYKLKSQLRI